MVDEIKQWGEPSTGKAHDVVALVRGRAVLVHVPARGGRAFHYKLVWQAVVRRLGACSSDSNSILVVICGTHGHLVPHGVLLPI